MIKVLLRFLKFVGKENEKRFKLAVVLSIFNSVFFGFQIPAVMYIIMGITSGGPLKKYIVGSFAVLAASAVLQILVQMKSTMLQTRAGYNAAAFKRIDIAQKLRYLPMGYFNENSIGNISSIVTNTMESLANVATRAVLLITRGVIDIVIFIIIIAFFDIRVAAISAFGTLLFFIVNAFKQNAGKKCTEEKLDADNELISEVVEYIQGIAEVRSYNLFGKRSKKLNEANLRTIKTNKKMEFAFIPYSFAENAIIRLGESAIILFSVFSFCNGTMNLIYAIGMTIMSFIIFSSLESAGSYSALVHAINVCVEKAESVLELENMEIDGKTEKPLSADIELKDVVFSYDKKKVIDGISLKIPAKSSLAIVGSSGGGKTTLTRLLARFWDIESGEITIGGENIKDFNIDTLMSNFSFVFQNVYLFNDTIENNIKFSNPAASHEEVVRAAKKASCDKFIDSLPGGYNTVIGEGGTSLSGGEKQRISIARAIMKDSPVIILDEATANVDPENEKELAEAIESLTKNKTVIMIAHRLKTVRNADNIIVVDKGKIVQQGTHGSLLKEDGIYRRFIDSRELAVSWRL